VTIPTHLILVLNRETHDLKLVSAHGNDYEAGYAFASLSSLFASTPNDVHKLTVPSDCGFVDGEIVSSHGKAPSVPMVEHPGMHIQPGAIFEADLSNPDAPIVTKLPKGEKPRNGIHQNHRGEYVQKLADGSEIISTSDFGDD
jgi:hypothetical protein